MRWFIFFHPRPSSILPSGPGSALRHREVADCPEVADSVDVDARTCSRNTTNFPGCSFGKRQAQSE